MLKVILACWRFEGWKLPSKKYAIGLMVLLFVVLAFVQNNIFDYKNSLVQVDSFKDFENKKVEQFFNYRIYSTYGFRMMFSPATLSILCNNSVIDSDLVAFADGGERLNFYKPFYGKKSFEMKKNLFSDYFGIIQIIGILIVLLYGCNALSNGESLRFLASFTDKRKLFWGIYIARIIWIFTIFLFIMGCSLLLALLNGITIPIDRYVLTSFLVTFIVLVFFFSVGFASGIGRPKLAGYEIAILIGVMFIIVFPIGVNTFTSKRAEKITPINELEWTKLKIYSDWENEWIKKEGTRKLSDEVTEKVKDYMNHYKENELKKLQELEDKMISQMENNARFYQFLSNLFPTSYYQSVNNEISSRGYNELIEFNRYSQKLKIDFVNMIIDKEYFTGYSKVETFSKNNANIYKAHPGLPADFLLGFIMTLIYVSGFVAIAYTQFYKTLFGLQQKEKEVFKYKSQDVVLTSGKLNLWHSCSNFLNRLLYNLFSNESQRENKKWVSFNVLLDNQVLNTVNMKQDFLYLCQFTAFTSEIIAIHYLNMVMELMGMNMARRKEIRASFNLDSFGNRTFSQLDKNEQGIFLMAILDMKPFSVYLIDNVTYGAYFKFCFSLKEKMSQFANVGAAVVFLFDEFKFQLPREKTIEKTAPFSQSNIWLDTVNDPALSQYPIEDNNDDDDDNNDDSCDENDEDNDYVDYDEGDYENDADNG